MYLLTPFDIDSISAMPIMPMLPAKAVSTVLPFFVIRLLSESDRLVKKPILALPDLTLSRSSVSGEHGSESSVTSPSLSRTILVAYFSASSGLCVTITTRRFSATFFSISITWTLVSESRAPVGSSASSISGSFTSARAIATLCICPPDSWFGLFLS